MSDKNPCMKGEGPRVVFMMLQQRSRVANGIPNMLHLLLIIHSTHHTENTLLSKTIFEGREEPSRSHR